MSTKFAPQLWPTVRSMRMQPNFRDPFCTSGQIVMLSDAQRNNAVLKMPMSDHDPRAIAQRLEWLRHYFGKSQKEFAASLDVLPSTYNNWLRGQHGLSLDGARRIKQRYNITLDFLFFGEAENLPEQIRNAWEFRPRS